MHSDPDDRLEVHNAAFDEGIANAHLCGMTDLRTGRTCIKPVHHHGSCEFVAKDVARDAAQDSSPTGSPKD